jgi:hypothetical protein
LPIALRFAGHSAAARAAPPLAAQLPQRYRRRILPGSRIVQGRALQFLADGLLYDAGAAVVKS